jgi:hypothetical protein
MLSFPRSGSLKEETLVHRFKRRHDTGTEAVITEHADCWRIQINLREPNHNPMTLAGYRAPTGDKAKELADREISSHGHVCNGSCQDWRKERAAP